MSTQRLSGGFPAAPGAPVLIDIGNADPSWTTGQTRVANPGIQQGLGERWSVLGFSLRCTAHIQYTATPYYGKLGNLWAGILVGNSLQAAGSGVLPQDLTTFAKVADGPTELSLLPAAPVGTPTPWGTLATVVQLPLPIDLATGEQLQLALVLTPSLTAGAVRVSITEADYTIVYDTGNG